ncbi:hypothetical protein N7527_006475, partial [Penicillium freii]
NTTWTSKPEGACGRYFSHQIHFATSQPIEEAWLKLSGPNVYAKMSDVSPPQPTGLVYWTAPRVSPRQKREYHVAGSRRSRSEDSRPQYTRARTTALCCLFVPSFGHLNIEPLTSHESGPKDTAARCCCIKP